MNDMGEIIHRFNVVPGETLSVDQVKAMAFAVKAGEIKLESFKQVAGITKSYNSVAIEAAKSLTAAIETAGKVQESAIDGFKQAIQSLERIALATDDRGARDKITDLIMKITDKIEKADERNTAFMYAAIGVIASVILTVITRRPVNIA